ncbi:MAG: hypothetical protein WBQ78_14255 [Gammaproteobacteria bacterium]
MNSAMEVLRVAVYVLVLTLIPLHAANSAYIPLLGGLIVYNESATIRAGTDVLDFATGTSQFLAENIQVAFGATTGSASNTVGSGQTPALTLASAIANEPGLGVFANTDITFEARLIKLHPDAPDNIGIPLLYTSSLSATEFGLAELVIGAGATLVQEQVNAGTIAIDSSLSVLANDFLRIEISASASAGGITNEVPSASASASTPVFAIDPDFTVEFLGRTERAVDLYTLAVTPDIGFAGDFQTVTPFTDGCLPDPSILTTSGTPSVTDGSTVTCQAIDPSGFRSYGNDPGDLSGVLNGLEIVVTPGATVETNADDTETFGILGNDNALLNQGTVRSAGENSEAVFFGGDGNEVTNEDDISTSGDTSTAVFMEGDFVSVLNEGVITTDGFQSSAVVLEGDDARELNEGEIQTSADQSAGLVIEGDAGTINNSGTIGTQGAFAAGMVMLGFYSESIENTGTITTIGNDAMGILALGPGHTVDNLDTEIVTGVRNRIWTTGARAHGIALGLQDPPPGIDIPAPALQPAIDSVINNTGLITTEGDEADAIHAFADNLPVTNTGELSTTGVAAHGISITGSDANIRNAGELSTAGIEAHGVYVDGNDAVINVGDNVETGSITTSQLGAKGIYVAGDRARVNTSGGATAATVLTMGENADGILITGDFAEVLSEGNITTQGNNSYGIVAFGNNGQFESAGTITGGQGVVSSGNHGIDINGSVNNVLNTGIITINSNDGAGLFVRGDNVAVANGDAGNRSAQISVTGYGAAGIDVGSNAAAVVNEGRIQVSSSENARAISVLTGIASVFQVTSSGSITVDGLGATGMSLSTSDVWGSATAGGPAPACTVIGDGTGKLVNCGSIDFSNSAFGAGMVAEGVANTTVENQGLIEGSGDAARGIRVISATGGIGDRNNLITNVDRITVSGLNVVGMEIIGESNVILHGNGQVRIPTAPFEYPTDLQDVFGLNLFPNAQLYSNEFSRDVPSGTIIPVADISVTGPGAIGLSVSGTGNRIAQIFSGQADNTRIMARGAGAIGVQLAGIGNMFVNGGEVIADGVGIQGGSGSDSIVNQNYVEGGIDLAGGPDRLLVDDASRIVGMVDGGAERDELIFFVPTNYSYTIDGDQYVNFEDLWKIGGGRLLLTNTLRGDELLLEVGELELADSAARLETSSSSIHVRGSARLSGNGTAVGSLLLEGGILAPGSGVGSMTVEGSLVQDSGILEFEANSLLDTDQLFVSGDVTFNSGFVDVILGFTPTPDELLEFLVIQGTLNIAEDFGGIRGFAAAGSGVALGTQFMVELGGQLFQGTVSSVVPIPPSALLFGSGLLGLVFIARRRKVS